MLVSTPDSIPEFERISTPKLRQEVLDSLLKELAGVYQFVYEQLRDEGNGYVRAEAEVQVRHSPEKIRQILGVQ